MTDFEDRIEFSSGYDRRSKALEEAATELQADIDAYLKAGGSIEKLKYCHVEEIISHVGQWTHMGDLPIGDQYDWDNILTTEDP